MIRNARGESLVWRLAFIALLALLFGLAVELERWWLAPLPL